jgi:hypothetical protein
MRYIPPGILIVTLGLWCGRVSAQESAPVIKLERPVALPAGDEPPPIAKTPATFPIKTALVPLQDSSVKPVSFAPPLLLPVEQSGGNGAAPLQPMPAGPALDTDAPPLFGPVNGNTVSRRLVPQPIETTPAPKSSAPAPISRPGDLDTCDEPMVGAGCIVEDGCGWFCGCANCIQPPPSRIWFSAEYLAWWTKGQNLPPLLTTGPAGLNAAGNPMAGVLGAPGTTVIVGGNAFDGGERNGARFTLGYWFTKDESIGVEGSYFFLSDRSSTFSAMSPGTPTLARPFFNVTTGMEDSELIAFPPGVSTTFGGLGGGMSITSTSRFSGADLDLRANLFRGCCWRIDLLAGARYLSLEENLSMTESLGVLSAPPPVVPAFPANGFLITDSFGTRNEFYGGQLGIDMQFRRGRWSLNLMEKLAIGETHEVANIFGGTTFFLTNGTTTTQPGGLLAQPSNIGSASRDRFAISPETGIKLGYQLTDHIQLFAAYSFLYISNVIDPAHVIDRGVNTSQLPSPFGPGVLVGPARPAFLISGSDYWAQGVSIGVEIRF